MWDHPRRVTDVVAKALWDMMKTNTSLLYESRSIKADTLGNEAAVLVFRWYNDTIDALLSNAVPYGDQMAVSYESFRSWFGSYFTKEVLGVEQTKKFGLFATLTNNLLIPTHPLSTREQKMVGTMGDFMYTLGAAALVLVGNEGKVLVGCRNGVPVWKKIGRVTPQDLTDHLVNTPPLLHGKMQYVGPGDAWLVPEFREFDKSVFDEEAESDTQLLEVNSKLIEHAFYNQRYIIDPEGAHVRLTDARGITDVKLKVRATEGDSLVDILARLETTNGAYFTVISEDRLLHPERDQRIVPSVGSYPAYVVCQVYNDLVTATELREVLEHRTAVPSATGNPVRGTTFRGTVIPRRRGRRKQQQVRTPVPEPLIREPKRVRGHPRKAQMTEQHRQALLEFERQYGVRILEHLQPGETFVRPHFNPHATPEEITSLPRFVRYRIQQELQESLRRDIQE